MARSMWKGAIQFGLVTIPVKLYTATDSKSTISFNMLHEKDLARINMKIWCPEDEKIIPRSETVKGYEWAPDQYVVIEEEDLENVPLATVRSIEIHQFVPRDGGGDSATRFVKQAYYIEPDPVGRKAFALLKSVLADKDLTAICKIALRDREHLAALDPFDKTMLLTTIHWPDEIKSLSELDLPDEEPTFRAAERAMAEQLVAAMTEEFDPTQYRDEYKEAVLRVIEAKVEGKEIEPAREARDRQPRRPDGRAPGQRRGDEALARGRPARVRRRGAQEGRGQGRRRRASGPPPRRTRPADADAKRPAARTATRTRQARAGPRGSRGSGSTRRTPAEERLAPGGRAASHRGRQPRGRAASQATRASPLERYQRQARLRQDARARRRSGGGRPSRRHRARRPAVAASWSSATARRGSTTTSGSRSTASSPRGPCRRARRSTRRSGGWPSTSRTTRSSTSISRA